MACIEGLGAKDDPLFIDLRGEIVLGERRALIGEGGFLADDRDLPRKPALAGGGRELIARLSAAQDYQMRRQICVSGKCTVSPSRPVVITN